MILGNDYNAHNHEVFVIDSPCGAGKTEFAIQNITLMERGRKFIYITPYLDEVQRVLTACKNKGIWVSEPTLWRGEGSKSSDFKQLLADGKNIVTTHSMFDKIDETMIDIIRSYDYTLYLDEVHEVIREHYLDEQDLRLLFETKSIEVDNKGLVKWIREDYTTIDGKFTEFRNLCDLGAMYYYSGRLFLWCFPIQVFEAMRKTYILTYLFEGQLQSAYYKLHKVEYYKKWVIKTENDRFYKLIDYDEEYNQKYIKNIRDKINIYEGNLNFQKGITLTTNWYNEKSDDDSLKVVKKNTYNYFRNIVQGKSEENMWTTLKDYKKKLKGKGYTNGFVELNARATNKYRHKKNLVYLYNRYIKPPIYNFLVNHEIYFDNNMYAIGDLIQWIFRSAIRDGQPVNIYLPSERMRRLLKEYLGKE